MTDQDKNENIDVENADNHEETIHPMLPMGVAGAPTENCDDKKPSGDIIENSIGGMGKYQIFLCFVIFLTKFPVAFHQMAIIFLAPPVQFECASPVTQTNETNVCPCDEPIYDRSRFENTIIMSWDLVCGRAWLADFTQTIFMLGILIGSVVFGSLSDLYGRRRPLIASVVLQIVGGIAASQAPEYWSFTVFRFVVGLATGGTMVAGYVLVLEFIGKNYREPISALYQLPFNFGHLMLAGFGYFFRTWSSYQLALTVPSIVLLSYFWIIPESPRWLLTVGETQRAITILKSTAKTNRLPYNNISDDVGLYQKSKSKQQLQKGKFLDLFRTKTMRTYTLCMAFNWLVCGYGFYGVTQYIGRLAGNIFVNVAVSAFITIPGTLLSIPLMKRVGRKPSMIGSLTFTSVCLFGIAMVPPTWHLLRVALSCLGVVSIFIAFIIVYLYASEVFPTAVRNAGIGLSSMTARVGSMIAPFVANAGAGGGWFAPVCFGVVPLIGAGLIMLLPETKDCELMNTVEEVENFKPKKDNNR